MKKSKRLNVKQFSVSFPESLLEEIDIACHSEYTTRTSWLVAAAKERLENDRLKKIAKLKRGNDDQNLI